MTDKLESRYGTAWEGFLDELDDYLAGREDIRDGEDGKQLPNQEMNMLTTLRYLRDVRPSDTRSETRDSVIEECAKAIEPANHPLLLAATNTIRALKQSVPPGSAAK